MTILGIVGRRGAGKDTVGRMVHDAVGSSGDFGSSCHCRLFSFAEPLKRHLSAVFDWETDVWSGRKENPDRRYDRAGSVAFLQQGDRELLYAYERWWGRSVSAHADSVEAFIGARREEGHYGPDCVTPRYACQRLGTEGYRALWLDVWAQYLVREIGHEDPLDLHVITDVRYPNEASVVRAAGGVLWRVSRLSYADASDTYVRLHDSESHCEDLGVDVELVNGGTLNDLRAKVVQQVRVLLDGRDPETGVWCSSDIEDTEV